MVALYLKSKESSSWREPNDKVFIPEFTSSITAVSDDRHESFSFFEKDLPQGPGSSNSAIRHQVQAERVQWNHATLGFPPQSSFVKALGRDLAIPGIDTNMVRSNFPSSVPQSLGRLTQLRQGIQSTKTQPHVVPPENNSTIEEIPFATDDDFSEFLDAQVFNKIYSKVVAASDIVSADLSGKLKITSTRGHQYILFFIWNNYIHYEPIIVQVLPCSL